MNARDKLRKKIRGDKKLNESISDQVRLEQHAGEGDLKTLKLNTISLNPKNPRKLNISIRDLQSLIEQTKTEVELTQSENTFSNSNYRDQLLININKIYDGKKKKDIENVFFLATSIHQQYLIQPISVLTDADNHNIIQAGERRYWAHIILERETIRATIRQKSSDPLRDHSVPLIENIIREDLSTSEKIDYIEELIQIYEEYKNSNVSALILSELIHESERTCRRYLRFISASEIIRDKIRTGELVSIRDIENAIKFESNHKEADETQNTEDIQATKTERVGRKRKVIFLGKTESIEVIKLLAEAIGKVRPLSIEQPLDWNDLNSVQIYWDELINLISSER